MLRRLLGSDGEPLPCAPPPDFVADAALIILAKAEDAAEAGAGKRITFSGA